MVLNGTLIRKAILAELAEKVQSHLQAGKRPPHLAAVLIGEDPASQTYVAHKVRDCQQVGYQSTLIHKEAAISQAELLGIIAELNQDARIDGFIVQLPLPAHLSEVAVIEAIAPEKDVDGFHPVNIGRMSKGLQALLPATPAGIVELLQRYGIETQGKHCVVVGRSNIVGTPMALLMSRNRNPGNCTVTLCHSHTQNLGHYTRQADILIAAAGQPEFISADMVKEGAVVIDVGIHRKADASHPNGFRLVGDVQYDQVAPKAKAITPVPGGVGPMTRAMLLLNTYHVYHATHG
ncbi:MAG: bifunctional methylenetetrahydrofolate dehydrogenase/methenyltetrahydrofolate cyclohydrolase FolD [Bacteroidetes bacterium]|jgi:methylenetetrahydrofolate dehydrogenase (NADP+)/methenyltetrahydrofolate cyclohydrolase|nr:bifunctional methylenetetrahydrofolate dehydrogenase/methenyltetrahydrofolate cyclohydrolase FolD [Bacteroidota bacterium]